MEKKVTVFKIIGWKILNRSSGIANTPLLSWFSQGHKSKLGATKVFTAVLTAWLCRMAHHFNHPEDPIRCNYIEYESPFFLQTNRTGRPRHRCPATWTPEQLQEISRFSNSNYEMDFDGKGRYRLESAWKKGVNMRIYRSACDGLTEIAGLKTT